MSGAIARLRASLEALLPWTVVTILGVDLLQSHPSEAVSRLVHQNGAVILVVAILMQYAPRWIESQQAQAVAITALTEALRTDRQRDDYERREVLGVLRVLAEDVRDLKREIEKEPADGQRRGS